jgi:hypothetical protein
MKVTAATAGSMFYVTPGTTPVSVATALAYIGRFPKSKLLVTDTSENIAKISITCKRLPTTSPP